MLSGLRKGCQEEQDLTGLGLGKAGKVSCWRAELDPIFISVHCRFFALILVFKNIKVLLFLSTENFGNTYLPKFCTKGECLIHFTKAPALPLSSPRTLQLHKQHLCIYCSTSYLAGAAPSQGPASKHGCCGWSKGWQRFLTVLEHFLWPGICAKHFTNTIWIRTNSDRLGGGECYASPNILLSSQ